MNEHPNAKIYRRAGKLLAARDIAGYLDHVSDSIIWWEVDISEPLVGKSALLTHLRNTPDRAIKTEIHDVLANEEHLVALIHAVAGTGDERLDLSYAEVLHFEEGLIAKRQVFSSNVRTAVSFFEIE